MRLSGFFVTGTDTAVGKTTVVAVLARALRARGLRVLAAKPVESGNGDDAARIAAAAGHAPVCRYRFAAPVAPGVAAEQAGLTIDFDLLAADLSAAWQRGGAQLALVEGAGGLLCPLGGRRTMADLAAHLGLPLLVVARAGLGTINHTLLTVAEAERRGLAVAGIVLSQVTPEHTPDQPSNPHWIARLTSQALLGTLRHGEPTPPEPLLQLAAQAVVQQEQIFADHPA